MVLVLNRLVLPQGMHAPFVATGALVTFGLAEWLHGSGFLAVYVAGLIVGNRETRAHNTIVTFLDAATWLAQIAMFVLLGLLAWPERLPQRLLPALAVALVLMLIARPAAVLVCLAPFRFSLREKLFISWVGLRGAVSVFLAAIPMLVGLPGAHFYFDVAFVVVMLSLRSRAGPSALAGRLLRVGLPRTMSIARRTELDLPGTLKQELVGYPVVADSPYLRRGITPSWAKLTLVVRDEHVLTPEEARAGARGRSRLFPGAAGPGSGARPLLCRAAAAGLARRRPGRGFLRAGRVTLGALAEIYGLTIPPEDAGTPLADYFAAYFIKHPPRVNDAIPLGPVKLVAHTVTDDRVVTVGLQLAEPEPRAAHDVGQARDQSAPDVAPAVGARFGVARVDAPSGAAPARRRRTAPRPRTDRRRSCISGTAAPARSTASGPAKSSAVHAAERPHREVRGGEEDQRARQRRRARRRARRRSAGPGCRPPPAASARHRPRRHPPVVEADDRDR